MNSDKSGGTWAAIDFAINSCYELCKHGRCMSMDKVLQEPHNVVYVRHGDSMLGIVGLAMILNEDGN